AAVEIAARRGARVIAAAGGPEKGALARRHGAAETIDYGTERWSDRVKALTEGRGVDVVVDPVGGAATLEALRAIAWNGRLLVVGFASGEIPQIPANRLLLRRASAIGVYWSHDRDGPMVGRVAAALGDLLRAGALHPHVGARRRFDDLPAALADLSARRTTGKAVLDLSKRDDAA
ncbi:zinc-binding dehydrogenase, partial [Rhodoplanes roseus]